jgi:hypothetical protein
MKIYYDFHIHTGLSPCGSEDMSPNNILNMATIKGLDAIAITDHNSIKNVEVICKLSENYDLMVIPGMEIQTQEDIHSVVLFESVNMLTKFYKSIEPYQLKLANRPEKFGDQLIFNEEDRVVDIEKNYLIAPFNIDLEGMIEKVLEYDGVVFPAHINRNSYSILKNLGFIPEHLPIKNVEWYQSSDLDMTAYKNKMSKTYRPLFNSDAHDLIQISERVNFLEVDDYSIGAIFKLLKSDLQRRIK